MRSFRILLILLSLACLPSLAWGQPWGYPSSKGYPETPYQSFAQPVSDHWPTSSPVTLDGEPGVKSSSNRAMSPDSWSATPSFDEFNGSYPATLSESAPTPRIPDLKSQSPYSNVGFGQQTDSPIQFASPEASKNENQFVPNRTPIQPSTSALSSQTPQAQPTGPRRYPLFSGNNASSGTNDFRPAANSSTNQPVSPAFDAVEDWYGSAPAPPTVKNRGEVSTGNEFSKPTAVDANTEASTDPNASFPNGFGWGSTPNPNPGQPTFGRDTAAFRPDMGQREPDPTVRNFGSYDNGQAFDFETKKRPQPPLRETLKTGRYFGSVGVLYLKPAFQANTAFTTTGWGTGESIPFDFDYESGPMIRLGFESKQGPGVEVSYWRYDETSNLSTFTSDGTTTGTVSTWMLGPHSWSRLSALNAGESISTSHTVDVDSINASFFKQVQLPISRINGRFGFQWATVRQFMDATLSDSGGTIAELRTRSDLQGFGPSFAIEYYRPIGHTKLEFVTSVGGSLLFGQRDQFVQNSQTGDFNRIGADEFLTTADLLTGVQYMKMVAENRGFFARLGLTYQTWMGGGTAVEPEGDFGLRGFSFTLGYNR